MTKTPSNQLEGGNKYQTRFALTKDLAVSVPKIPKILLAKLALEDSKLDRGPQVERCPLEHHREATLNPLTTNLLTFIHHTQTTQRKSLYRKKLMLRMNSIQKRICQFPRMVLKRYRVFLTSKIWISEDICIFFRVSPHKSCVSYGWFADSDKAQMFLLRWKYFSYGIAEGQSWARWTVCSSGVLYWLDKVIDGRVLIYLDNKPCFIRISQFLLSGDTKYIP